MKSLFYRLAVGLITMLAICQTALANPQQPSEQSTIWVTTRVGESFEGQAVTSTLAFVVDRKSRDIDIQDLLSFHSAEPASEKEAGRIAAGLATLAGTDIQACEGASAELVDIGVPVMTPLLKTFQDTDAHEPDYRYRLFGRLMPGFADCPDRSLGLLRLVGGETVRGRLATSEIKLKTPDGKEQTVLVNAVRRLATEQDLIERTFELQALKHCTYVGFLDTGIAVRPDSVVRATAQGFVRLSFDEDGWAADPDGIKEPLEGKRKLQEGFRWGAVLGRIGPEGERWFAGKEIEKSDLGSGRLYFVINDNEHWQNNIGSFRMQVQVTNAYDLGDAK